MAKIAWKRAFSIGNELIDGQHRELIEYFNAAHEHMLSNQNTSSLGINSLIRLVEYCRYHFASEEEYMEKIGFQGVQAHKRIHSEFYAKLNQTLKQLDQGEGEWILASEMLKLTENWIVHHILNEDQKIRERA